LARKGRKVEPVMIKTNQQVIFWGIHRLYLLLRPEIRTLLFWWIFG